MIDRAAFLRSGAGASAALAMPRTVLAAGPSLPPLSQKVPLTVAYSVSISNLGVLAAAGQGFFSKHNLDVRLVSFRGATEVNEALAAGKVDVGTLGLLPAILGYSDALGTRVLCMYSYGGDRYSLIVNKTSGIKNFSDFADKRVAAVLGSDVQLAAIMALQRNGVDVKRVRFVNMAWTDMISAAARGELDAYNENEPQGTEMLQQFPDKVQMFLRLGKYFDGAGIFVGREDWIQGQALASKHLVVALWEAMKWVRDNPHDAAVLMSRSTGNKLTVEASLEGMKLVSYDPRIRSEVDSELAAAADLAVEQGRLSKKVDLRQFTRPAYDLLRELSAFNRALVPA